MQTYPLLAVLSVWHLILLIIILILLVPLIFYLLTLQKAFYRCSTENRHLSPKLVWLMLIPVFNLYWHFVIIFKLTKSFEDEFKKREIPTDPNPAFNLGLLLCFSCVFEAISPFIHFPIEWCFLERMVCWIVYWVKIAKLSGKLALCHSV